MVENCGMENEKIHLDAEDIPSDASYFSLLMIWQLSAVYTSMQAWGKDSRTASANRGQTVLSSAGSSGQVARISFLFQS